MIIIKNITWNHTKPSEELIYELGELIRKQFRSKGIVGRFEVTDGIITIVKDNPRSISLLTSSKDNYIHLKKGDPRIKKMKRNYLLSRQLTKDQHDFSFNVIQDCLDGLLLSADITFDSNDERIVLRNGWIKVAAPQKKMYSVDAKP